MQKGAVAKTVSTDTEQRSRKRRKVVKDEDVVRRLFEDVAPDLDDRNSGYTRILRIGPRKGDGAEQVYLELVNYEPTEN